MRNKIATFFECTCRYSKTMEDGSTKIVKETNVVEAINFSEAEKRFIEEMNEYYEDALDVTAIKIAQYKEVFFSDKEEDDGWYKVKLAFIVLDEKTGKEKRNNVIYLIQANSLDRAVKYINDIMKETMTDYSSISVQETGIFDVFEHTAE